MPATQPGKPPVTDFSSSSPATTTPGETFPSVPVSETKAALSAPGEGDGIAATGATTTVCPTLHLSCHSPMLRWICRPATRVLIVRSSPPHYMHSYGTLFAPELTSHHAMECTAHRSVHGCSSVRVAALSKRRILANMHGASSACSRWCGVCAAGLSVRCPLNCQGRSQGDQLDGLWRLVYSSGFARRNTGGARPGVPISVFPAQFGQVRNYLPQVSAPMFLTARFCSRRLLKPAVLNRYSFINDQLISWIFQLGICTLVVMFLNMP